MGANLRTTHLPKQGYPLSLNSHRPCGLRFPWRLSFQASADEAQKSGINRDSMLHFLSVRLLLVFGAGIGPLMAIKPFLGLGFESSTALTMGTSLPAIAGRLVAVLKQLTACSDDHFTQLKPVPDWGLVPYREG